MADSQASILKNYKDIRCFFVVIVVADVVVVDADSLRLRTTLSVCGII